MVQAGSRIALEAGLMEDPLNNSTRSGQKDDA
jgi:hypothetical protein